MKRFLPFALIVVLLISIGGFLLSDLSLKADQDKETVGPASEVQLFRTISAAEAAELIRTRENLEVIDVRTPQERKQFRIADTRLVPVGDVIRGVFEADPDKPVMLICAVGGRSYVAGKVMFARGYREGLPLETGPENPPQ